MEKKNCLWMAAAILAVGGSFTACSSDDEAIEEAPSAGRFVISAKVDDANYILTAPSLSDGEVTAEHNGLEASTGTEWVFYKNKYLFRLQYNQGNAGVTEAYQRSATGGIEKRDITYQISNRFTTFGIYGNCIITAASVDTEAKNGSSYKPKGLAFTYLNAVEEKFNTKVIDAENFLGNGEYVTFSGILEANNKLYTAVIPLGMSAYGIEQYPDKVVDQSLIQAGSGRAETTDKTITNTQHPDSAWVAIYKDDTFTNPTILRTNKMSYACGRMRSQYYQTIWAADNGDVYVFSPSFARTASGIQKSTHKSAVMRIKAGTEKFDESFNNGAGVFDLETAAGSALYRCWHLTGDYFLLQLFTGEFNSMGKNAMRLAIFNGSDLTVKTVSGLPSESELASFSKFPFAENGVGYISVATLSGDPAIYLIDPATAVATRGLSVKTATEVSAMGVLE